MPGIIALGTSTLNVNGKLRTYYAAVGNIPGTSSVNGYSKYPFTSSIGGKVSIVGNTRSLTASDEWGANITSPWTGNFPLEINLNSGQTVAINTAIKCIDLSVISGTLEQANALSIGIDNGTTGQGNITIANGAAIISDASSSFVFQRTGTTKAGIFTLNGTLILKGNSPKIAMNEINLNGTVEYAGSGAQVLMVAANISIPGAAPNNYTNISIANVNSGVTISSNVTATNVIIKPAAKLTLNSGITLTTSIVNIQSDATRTGTFIDGNSSNAFNATVNQYLPSVRNWYMTSPVNSATPTNTANFYAYNENNNSWANPSSMDKSKGYIVVPTLAGQSVAFSGVLNNGDQTISLTNSTSGNPAFAGYNLVGNPYPSYIDWTNVYPSAVNIEPTMWYRTNTGNVYQYWTVNSQGVVSPSEASKNIPPMQGFWVKVLADQTSGTLNFTNAMRSHSAAANLLKVKQQNTEPIIRLQVSNGKNTDEAVIYFNSNANNGQDVFDSQKLNNNSVEIPEIYTLLNNRQIVINGMKDIPYDTPVTLGFNPGKSGNFTIRANEFSNFTEGTSVILKDAQTSTETDVTNPDNSYSFTSNASPTTNRFSVIFKSPNVATGSTGFAGNNTVHVYQNSNNHIVVAISDELQQNAKVEIFNISGQKLFLKTLTAKTTEIKNTFSAGVYVVKVTHGNPFTTKVVVN